MANIHYRTHCSNIGWQDRVFDNGETGGTVGENRPLEAYRIESIDVDPGDEVGIAAHAHVQDLGWSDPTPIGQDVGSTGLGKAIEAIKMGLTGKDANKYDLFYRLHIQNYDWLAWSRSPDVNGTTGGAIPAEAIQIILAKKDEHVMPSVISSFEYRDMTPQPQPKPAPSGGESEASKRARIVAIAQSYVGYVKSGSSLFGSHFGDPYGDYCCYFDWYVFEKAGLDNLIPHTGYCPTAVDWFKAHKTAQFRSRGTYTPKNGDLIYFDWSPYNGIPNHTGVVEGCDGSTVCTIEANTGSPNGVKRKYWGVGDREILGYGVPDYNA